MKVTNVTLVIYKVNMGSKNILLKLNLISCHGNKRKLRWLDRLKNEDIHQIYDVFENTIFKALEHL